MSSSSNLIITSINDNNGCFSNPLDSAYVLVNELPLINILLDDICENVEPFAFSDAEPVGGSFYLDKLQLQLFNPDSVVYRSISDLRSLFFPKR